MFYYKCALFIVLLESLLRFVLRIYGRSRAQRTQSHVLSAADTRRLVLLTTVGARGRQGGGASQSQGCQIGPGFSTHRLAGNLAQSGKTDHSKRRQSRAGSSVWAGGGR